LLEAYSKGLLEGIEWFPPELRRHIYELMGRRVTALKDGRLRISANVDAQIIHLTRNVEDYTRRRQERERGWSENPPSFEELAALIKASGGQQGGHQFDSPTTTAITSSEISKLA
jgi:hypothetical protein